MYCPKCGGQVQSEKQYCPKCKAPLFSGTMAMQQKAADGGGEKLKVFFKLYTGQMGNQKASKLTYNVIWFSLLISVGIYVVVMHIVNLDQAGREQAPFIMLAIMCFVALSSASFGFINLKMQLTQDKILKHENRDTASMSIQTAGIISLATFESVSIFGLVLNFIGFSKMYAYPFFIVSALLLIYSRTFTDPAWNLIETHPKFAAH